MDFYITSFIKNLLLPPGCFILFFVVGLMLLNKQEKVAKIVLWSNTIVLTLLSLPIVTATLAAMLERYPALDLNTLQETNAQAIIVLGSGRDHNAPEYGGADTVHSRALNRLRYGSVLHAHSGLPVLVAGGKLWDDEEPEAVLLARSLHDDFKVDAKWIEVESRNTAENAQFSFNILQKENINTIFLVTHAWHMARAKSIFEAQGFKVIPAPTRFEGLSGGELQFSDFMPDSYSLRLSYYIFHEMLGLIWYKIRY